MQKVSSLSPTKCHRAPYQLMFVRRQAWHLKKSPTRGIRAPHSVSNLAAVRPVFCSRTSTAVCRSHRQLPMSHAASCDGAAPGESPGGSRQAAVTLVRQPLPRRS